jgi:hypothetical protein
MDGKLLVHDRDGWKKPRRGEFRAGRSQLDLEASSMIGSVGSGPTIVQLFCGLGISVEGRYEAVETWA